MREKFWLRVLIGIGIIVLLLLPVVLLFLRNTAVPELLPSFLQKPQKEITGTHFSVQSNVSDYSVRLVDTRYLDYMAAKLGIFEDKGIVDPRVYQGFPDINLRYTVSGVRFALVPKLDSAVILLGGEKDFSGKGTYRVEDDTLVVEVSLAYDEHDQNLLTTKLSLDETFVRAALSTLYYAHGIVSLSDSRINTSALYEIKQGIKDNLYTGLFPWPLRIEQK